MGEPSTCRRGDSPRQKALRLDVLKTPERDSGWSIVRLEGGQGGPGP